MRTLVKMIRLFAGAALLALLPGACAGLSGRGGNPDVEASTGQEQGGVWSSLPPPGLPREAGEYLAEIARAFARQDGAFLLAQGEAAWDAAVRPRYDEATGLALLYRTGALSGGEYSTGGLSRLDCSQVKAVEFSGWQERGPLIEVRGRLVMRGGGTVPCSLLLVWRLREPKIQGVFP